MKMAFVIFKIVSIIMEAFIIAFVFNSTSRSITKFKQSFVYLAVIIIRSIIVICVNIPLVGMLMSFISAIVLSLLYKMAFAKKILVAVSITLAFVLIEMLVGYIVSSLNTATIEETQKSLGFYVECALGSKLIVLILAQGIKMLVTKDNAKLSKGMYSALLLLPMATCIIVFATSEVMYKSNDLRLTILMILGVVSIIIANYILMFITEKNIRQVIDEAKNKFFIEELRQQTKYYENLTAKYKVDNKKLHDIDKQFLIIHSLINNQCNEKAEEQLIKIGQIINTTKNIGFTGIIPVDAILNHMVNKISTTDIQFKKHIFIESLSNYLEFDFCLLLGNLLDNAYEECMRINSINNDNLFINCEIKQIDNYLSILVDNTSIKSNALTNTSKQDKYKHGYGMQIIKEIVEKHNGSLNIESSNDKYTSMLLLKLT